MTSTIHVQHAWQVQRLESALHSGYRRRGRVLATGATWIATTLDGRSATRFAAEVLGPGQFTIATQAAEGRIRLEIKRTYSQIELARLCSEIGVCPPVRPMTGLDFLMYCGAEHEQRFEVI